MLISFEAIHIYVSLAILTIALIVLRVQGKSLSYLLFCAVFGIYLIGVVSVVFFPIHVPEGNMDFNRRLQLNLVPFDFGDCHFLSLCIRNIYENILLTIPFGFGISFIVQIKPKSIPWLAIAVGLVSEFTQLIIALIVRSPFRVTDINDVIFNTTGVLLGYGIFKIFGWFYLLITHKFNIQHKRIFAYIHDVVCLAS